MSQPTTSGSRLSSGGEGHLLGAGPMDLERVSQLTTQGRYEFSEHAERERIHDCFSVAEVKGVAINGELNV